MLVVELRAWFLLLCGLCGVVCEKEWALGQEQECFAASNDMVPQPSPTTTLWH